jgi:hypothetical protein
VPPPVRVPGEGDRPADSAADRGDPGGQGPGRGPDEAA